MNTPISIIDRHTKVVPASGDVAARLRAVDVRNSCIVSAPAGSGKTELLTQRYLALLGTVKSAEEILAITFTKKAASEMRDRIFSALKDAQADAPVAPHQVLTRELACCALARSVELGWNILDNPNQLRIRTIDSFYSSLAKRAPLASRMGGGMKVSNNITECYEDAVRSLFESLDEHSDWQPHMVNLLTALDNRLDLAQNMLVSLLEKREQWLPIVVSSQDSEGLRHRLESDIDAVVTGHREDSLDKLAHHLDDICQLSLSASSNLPADQAELAQRLSLIESGDDVCWRSVYQLFFTAAGDVRKAATAAIGFPAPSSVKDKALKGEYKSAKDSFKSFTDALREDTDAVSALTELAQLPDSRYEESDWMILEALLKLLPVLAGKLLLEFQSFGAVDHTAVSSAALCALGGGTEGPSEVALSLDNQLRHILIDEFQDTNNVQIVGLSLLMAGWEPEDGRSLFCVGDAMQSIYGFRGSNVGLFLDAAQYGIADTQLAHLQLERNFRSEAGLVRWFNQFFKQAFPQAHRSELGAVSYCSSEPVRNASNEQPVTITAFTGDETSPREAEAFGIAERVEFITQQTPEDSIAVLVRSRSHLAGIVSALQDKDIAYQAIDIDPLEKSPMVSDLKALTLCIADPTDRISWLALLRSPLCGLKADELLVVSRIAKDSLPLRKDEWDALSADLTRDGLIRLQKVRDVLEAAQEHLCRKALADIVEGCWIGLYGPAGYGEAASTEQADQFFEMLRSLDGQFDARVFDAALSKLYARPFSGATAKVHLLTLHKSKGLEYDHIFIPCCERSSISDDKQLLAWDYINSEGTERALIAPGDAINDKPESVGRFLSKRSKLRAENEALRLLYVGCTRARKSLNLSFIGNVVEGELQKPRRNTFAEYLWQHAGSECEIVVNGPVSAYRHRIDGIHGESTAITRIADPRQLVELPACHLLEAYRGRIQTNEVVESTPESWSLQYAHHMGTVLHRIAAKISHDGIEAWLQADLGNYHVAWKTQLNQLGVPAYLLDHFTKKMHAHIERLLQADSVHWVFENTPGARNEAKFHSDHGVHTKTHVIDRLVPTDDHVWIIDYKSDERQKDESIDAFHDRLIDLHVSQLDRYRHVYTSATGRRVKLGIYAFETGQLLECA